MHTLELRNLTITRGNLVIGIFNKIFREDEKVLVYGPNGYGKTTLLLAIAGIMKHSGEILLDNRLVTSESLDKRGITYAPAKPSLINSITALENLKISGERAVEIAESIGLKNVFFQKAYRLSDGIKKLIQVSMAIGSKSTVILLDEPFAFVSEENSILVKSVIDQTKEKIIIMTSHEKLQPFSEYIDISEYQLSLK